MAEEVRKARNIAARERLQIAAMARIYAVQANEAVKFGRTAGRLEKRIKALQVGSPVDLKLVCWILAPANYETGIHHFLKRDAHLRGEWFKLNHPDTEIVLEAIASGEPATLKKIIYES